MLESQPGVICTRAWRSAICDHRTTGWRWIPITRRIRGHSIYEVFRKFDEVGSVRQVAVWLRQEGINSLVPMLGAGAAPSSGICPATIQCTGSLTNPVYAGAYVFGRTVSRAVMEAGRKVVKVVVSAVTGRNGV